MTRRGILVFMMFFVIGLIAGLFYAWQIDPVEYVDTAPDALRADFKSDYLALIAAAYAANMDLPRAQARLDLFSDPDPATTLATLAQQRLAEGFSEREARALAQLASTLGEQPTPYAQTPEALETALASNTITTPDIQPSPQVSNTPPSFAVPSRTPTPQGASDYELLSREMVCDPDLQQPLLQGVVRDAQGNHVPGVEILVIWDAGRDHFFTGLKPDLGLGYGDFTMAEGVIYAAQIAGSPLLVTDLTPEACASGASETYLGSWLLSFTQLSSP